MISSFRRQFEWLLTAFVTLLLASLAIIVLLGVTFRKLDASLVWYDEVASVMLAWLTYYGASLAALKRAHIGFPGLVNALPPPWRVTAVMVGEVIVIGFFATLAWFGYQVLVILDGDTLVSLPSIPTRLTQSVIPVGSVLFIVAQLLSLPELLEQARGQGVVDADHKALEEALQK
ncbi:MAG: TRAP transporter small permease [Hylemonella sp.]|nr:TRAP transporter small permease [Hylemonella sp.]MDH5707596.1 TRAP transporter small permease [Hylemonella sp.]